MTDPFYPPQSPIATGLACRCPRCGQGRLFSGYLELVEHCDICDLDLRDSDSGDGPAVFVIFALGFIVVPIALWVEARFQPPLWLHAVLWSIMILGGALALLRPFKGVMVALQYKHRGISDGS
ncbi:DUF983 domain-containing protein [Falsiroseomonas sp.]|uniref:DUF983 domain-containing protein n=1 Tax=Falsiroseomonas sp. TaxID=2870721 RepID=UPI0027208100|nr:DUF983 domain-containing protein [Falsiroseomonas sp.]MDO9502300.1 DUF983 domain-containing protein [Falsiroseomonas sp.]